MTNPSKNIALLVGFVLALVLCYKLAFAKTLYYKAQYEDLEHEALLFRDTPRQLSVLKQKERYYDSLLITYQRDGRSIQNQLLKSINGFAEGNTLMVTEFLEPHVLVQDELTIKSYQFTLEGSYDAIVRLLYQLEQIHRFGEVIHVHFLKQKNFKTGKDVLKAIVLIKNFG